MERQFRVIEWNIDVKRGYWRATGKMNRNKQNEIFERNALLRQKIVGCLVSLISMAIWIWFTEYDTKLIWWGCELFPVMIWGFYLMLTDKRVFNDLEKLLREENRKWQRMSK